jgi:hypothetical protein
MKKSVPTSQCLRLLGQLILDDVADADVHAPRFTYTDGRYVSSVDPQAIKTTFVAFNDACNRSYLKCKERVKRLKDNTILDGDLREEYARACLDTDVIKNMVRLPHESTEDMDRRNYQNHMKVLFYTFAYERSDNMVTAEIEAVRITHPTDKKFREAFGKLTKLFNTLDPQLNQPASIFNKLVRLLHSSQHDGYCKRPGREYANRFQFYDSNEIAKNEGIRSVKTVRSAVLLTALEMANDELIAKSLPDFRDLDPIIDIVRPNSIQQPTYQQHEQTQVSSSAGVTDVNMYMVIIEDFPVSNGEDICDLPDLQLPDDPEEDDDEDSNGFHKSKILREKHKRAQKLQMSMINPALHLANINGRITSGPCAKDEARSRRPSGA